MPLDAKGRESRLKVDAHDAHGVWHVLCMHMQASETGLWGTPNRLPMGLVTVKG